MRSGVMLGMGRAFRIGPQTEAASRNHASEWDASQILAPNRDALSPAASLAEIAPRNERSEWDMLS